MPCRMLTFGFDSTFLPGKVLTADNGGPTLTHALLEGSPAIDKGNSFGESTDQRGLPRPSDFVGITNAADGSDIGAFELQAPSTQPDTKAPRVVSTFPRNGREVGPAANIGATFSEEMRPASVMNAFKLFKEGSTNQIAARVSYDATTDRATLNPTNNLRRGVTYTRL
jgi:Bacterial Ig-like domain